MMILKRGYGPGLFHSSATSEPALSVLFVSEPWSEPLILTRTNLSQIISESDDVIPP